MPTLRPRRILWSLILACVLLSVYRYGFVTPFEATAVSPAPVTALTFPERTFRYSNPFFFGAGQTTALYVAAAPPDALPPGSKAWKIEEIQSGLHLVETDPSTLMTGFTPIPNGLDGAADGLVSPCAAASGKDMGGVALPAIGMQVQMGFRGVHFRKPVLSLFSLEGGSAGFRMIDVYFGKRSIEVCRGSSLAASMSQRLWNVPSAVRLPDMAFLSVGRRLLFITGDAPGHDAILAIRF